MTEIARRSFAIVGGGASGVIMAAHLLKASGGQARVSVVERVAEIGRGMAYSTELPDHRLNVPAYRMSAFPDDPLHLWRWYRDRHPEAPDEPDRFLQRRDFARYLAQVFRDAAASASGAGKLQHIQEECLSISAAGSGVELRLSNGISLAAQTAILSTGHDPAPHPDRGFAVACTSMPRIDPDAPVTILGSGLSMIDAWLTLEAHGHRGPIVVVSRRGLLPLPHGQRRNPIKLDSADIPFGTDLSYFVRWFSDLIEETGKSGGNWRDVIDGIRPFNQRIWRDWPTSAKRRFLEHAKAWWEVHRHRIAPDIHARALAAVEAGRLQLISGKIVDARKLEDGRVTLSIRLRGSQDVLALPNTLVVDCTGLVKDPASSANPLISALLKSGAARADAMRIGLDVTPNCAVIDANGVASERIFAVGPLTRGTFFEIDAVPEIREQCRGLAKRLAG